MVNPTPNEEITLEVIAPGARDASWWQRYNRLFGKLGFPDDFRPFQKRDVRFRGYGGSRILHPGGQLLTRCGHRPPDDTDHRRDGAVHGIQGAAVKRAPPVWVALDRGDALS